MRFKENLKCALIGFLLIFIKEQSKLSWDEEGPRLIVFKVFLGCTYIIYIEEL